MKNLERLFDTTNNFEKIAEILLGNTGGVSNISDEKALLIMKKSAKNLDDIINDNFKDSDNITYGSINIEAMKELSSLNKKLIETMPEKMIEVFRLNLENLEDSYENNKKVLGKEVADKIQELNLKMIVE